MPGFCSSIRLKREKVSQPQRSIRCQVHTKAEHEAHGEIQCMELKDLQSSGFTRVWEAATSPVWRFWN